MSTKQNLENIENENVGLDTVAEEAAVQETFAKDSADRNASDLKTMKIDGPEETGSEMAMLDRTLTEHDLQKTNRVDAAETEQLQKAIEKVVDDETSSIPPLPLSPDVSEVPATAHNAPRSATHTWFFTFMCMNIPIIGWIYLLYLAFNKKRTDRKEFARAYLFYKLVFLIVSAVILGILIYIGMGLLDQLLAYMQML